MVLSLISKLTFKACVDEPKNSLLTVSQIRLILISFRILETPQNSFLKHRTQRVFFSLFLWCNVTTSKECQFLAFVAALDIGWSHDNNRFHKFMVMYCALYRDYLINNYWSFKAAFLALFSQYNCGIGICAILGL